MAASANDLRPPPSSAKLRSDTVRRAMESLIKWRAAKSRTENPQLLADEEYVYLNLTLKKIPPKARVNPHKLPLPNPLHSQATGTELCIIVDDREKSKLTKAEAKKKIEADDIGVGKILKLSKLKTDYRAYEAKRKLCASYDMFLVDKRLIPLMPRLLGKQFYKKKKTGTCNVVKVARVAMEVEEIVDNVISVINGIVEILPKKWDGVRSFHLKLGGSLSLPIYQALPDLKLKISGVEKNVEEKVDEGEVTDDAKKDENVMKKSSNKGRIHEVRYIDTETNERQEKEQNY
uniref:Ribosomal protein L1 n=1 Tax=Kalanchoe fedtschenkoi TaxID=63787 RepID=A0A7N0TGN5_KALFE